MSKIHEAVDGDGDADFIDGRPPARPDLSDVRRRAEVRHTPAMAEDRRHRRGHQRPRHPLHRRRAHRLRHHHPLRHLMNAHRRPARPGSAAASPRCCRTTTASTAASRRALRTPPRGAPTGTAMASPTGSATALASMRSRRPRYRRHDGSGPALRRDPDPDWFNPYRASGTPAPAPALETKEPADPMIGSAGSAVHGVISVQGRISLVAEPDRVLAGRVSSID